MKIVKSFIFCLSIIFLGYSLSISAEADLKMRLGEELSKKLEKDGFVVVSSGKDDLVKIYEDNYKENIPTFVTTDAVLHSSHLLFDYSLRLIEIEQLYSKAVELSKGMFQHCQELLAQDPKGEVAEALQKNEAFFAVAMNLLKPELAIHPKLEQEMRQELEMIGRAQGMSRSPLFGYSEDYTQYKPRGHYTRNETFARYFQALMWYGRMSFLANKPQQTLSAILICHILDKDAKLSKLWEEIYTPTVLFVGKTDDASYPEYRKILLEIYGSERKLEDFQSKDKLKKATEKIYQLPEPKIVSSIIEPKPIVPTSMEEASRCFRFMGQRFIPDSYVFQQLCDDKVSARFMVTGLDVMGILGSLEAIQELKARGDFEKYPQYKTQFEKLQKEFAEFSEQKWHSNLYWTWLSALKTLLKKPSNSPLPCTSGSPWMYKMLNTASGSWAELRHDTILYAKQSYARVTAAPDLKKPSLTKGYVEPYPEFYRELSGMFGMILDNPSVGKQLPVEMTKNIQEFKLFLEDLERISSKEINGTQITDEEYEKIWNTMSSLSKAARLPSDLMTKIASGTDKRMPLVADVHTDPNKMEILQVAVGNPDEIYVLVKNGAETSVARGGLFSYYEFIHSQSDRLTDEQWQSLLDQQQQPARPSWSFKFRAQEK